jgi:glycosyltransferase involved in cell wall biosynthesis
VPFFTVVIPVLNEEEYLPRLLEDLEAQIDRDFEVVVVDGRSEDKTIERAMKYQDKLPKLDIIESEIRNVAHQRNVGAKRAGGKYLVFFDADVQIPSNYLSEIHFFLKERNKECRLLTTWFEPDSDEGMDRVVMGLYNLMSEVSKKSERPTLYGFAIVVERGLFKKLGGFDRKIRVGEDTDLGKRAVELGAEMVVLKNPKLICSLRRFRREGTLKVLHKYALASVLSLLDKPVTEEVLREAFDYEMGGKIKNESGGDIKLSITRFLKLFSERN